MCGCLVLARLTNETILDMEHTDQLITDWIPADLHGSGLDPTVPSLASAQGARADLPDDIDIIGVESFFTNRPDGKRYVFFFS